MTKEQLKSWISKNEQLQSACHNPNRDESLRLIQLALQYNPFMNYVLKRGGSVSNLVKYGLDFNTESAIREIDDIAKGTFEYEY